MHIRLPPPRSVPRDLKPVSSATAGSQTLSDGRKRYWVKHDVLKGVTPTMFVWWFRHLEGAVETEGRLLDTYCAWRPFGHVSARYVRRAPDGSQPDRGPVAPALLAVTVSETINLGIWKTNNRNLRRYRR